jgi:hypothetical protein
MNIVIPTYEKHKQYNINFVKSFEKYCLDKENVSIYFIVTEEDKHLFECLVTDYVKLITFQTLVNCLGIDYNSLNFNNQYSYQSLKKLLSPIFLKEGCVVIDSENLCVRPFYIKDFSKSIKNSKIIYTTKLIEMPTHLQRNVFNNCKNLLEFETDKWFFLKSYWYYEYDIVSKLLNELKFKDLNFLKTLSETIFFEYQLYCNYIEKYSLKPILEIDKFLSISLLNAIEEKKLNFEYVCASINFELKEDYCNIIKILDDRIIRLHWMSNDIENYVIENTGIVIGTYHWD